MRFWSKYKLVNNFCLVFIISLVFANANLYAKNRAVYIHCDLAYAAQDTVAEEPEEEAATEEEEVTSDSISVDSADDEADTDWSLYSGLGYSTSQSKMGADLVKAGGVFNQFCSIDHSSGFSVGFSVMENYDKTFKYNSGSFDLGYSYDLSDAISFDIAYSRSFFEDATVNIFAEAPNQVSLSAFYTNSVVNASLDYAYIFGKDNLQSLSLSLLKSIKFGDFRISPLLSVTGLAYEVSKNKLVTSGATKTNVKQKLAISAINACLGFKYQIIESFIIKLVPAYAYNLIKEISKKKSLYTLSLGVDYSLDF